MLYLNFRCQLYNHGTTKHLMSSQQYNQLSSHQHQYHRSVQPCITLLPCITFLIVFTTSIVMVWALAISCQVTMTTEIHCAVSHNFCLSYIQYHLRIIFHMNSFLALGSNNWMLLGEIVCLYKQSKYPWYVLNDYYALSLQAKGIHNKCNNFANDNVCVGFPLDQ